MSKDEMDGQESFDVGDAGKRVPRERRPRIDKRELMRLHDLGVRHVAEIIHPGAEREDDGTGKRDEYLFRYPDGARAMIRVRDTARLVDHPERLHQVTVRIAGQGGARTAEWEESMLGGRYRWYAYVWVNPRMHESLPVAWVVLNVASLVEDILYRPQCLVLDRDPIRGREAHHNRDGSEFWAVDVRRLRPESVHRTVIEAATNTAPYEVQHPIIPDERFTEARS